MLLRSLRAGCGVGGEDALGLVEGLAGDEDLGEAAGQARGLGELVAELLARDARGDALCPQEAAQDLGLEVGAGLVGHDQGGGSRHRGRAPDARARSRVRRGGRARKAGPHGWPGGGRAVGGGWNGRSSIASMGW